MYLVRRTKMGLSSAFKMQPNTPQRVWEWDGTNRFTDGSKSKIFGEGWSAIAPNIASANLLIDEYVTNLKKWDIHAIYKKPKAL